MDAKEKLIEMIQGSSDTVLSIPYISEGGAEALADYLLAEGVIVPLCKVGDTVYQTDGIRIYELEIFDVCLRKNKPYYETESIDFDADAIGKTVFLTREEAEKALAEIEGAK